jgi:HK97 family phage portal protein
VDNPDQYYPWKGKGMTVLLSDVANNLKQASATKKGFMSSKWKPSIIVKVDAMTEEFSGPEGRQKILDEYIKNTEAGEPWLIPADQFEVEQVRPLSLADLAISDSVEIDKRTVASIIGVPPFVLGVGDYNKDAWNAFIANTVRVIAQEIEQELTKKLILNPKWYLKFNILSLMDWDIKTISEVFGSLSDRGFVTGNEVRDRIGMSPKDGLDELRILENFIPNDMIGQQSKLVNNN